MSNNFSRSQSVRKAVTITSNGVVAAQHVKAAKIGAQVLENGGDAVDAAVAVSFVLGVLEPWMSGPAGGGAMMVWRADEQKAHAIWYGMKSPKSLDVAAYPLSDSGRSSDLFPWKSVVDDRNVEGPLSIAVPGVIAGIELAHDTFGKLPWRELLQPAVAEARTGLHVDWYAALIIASATRALSKDKDAADLFLEDGQWPTIAGWTALAEKHLDQSKLANTLSQLAEAGPRDFYEGEIARAMVDDVQAKGGFLSLDDLRDYKARIQDPLEISYRDAKLFAVPDLTAGPTLAHTLKQLEDNYSPGSRPDGETFSNYASALQTAYADRLKTMGDQEAPHAPSCTTHFSIVDRHGNMVSMTQTLLSFFGSRVVSPSTGFLMNNGIMWFDPEPGHPNSIAPDKTCLMNVCPILGEKNANMFAIGASGGRKIMPAVAQLASFITDFDMSLEEAFHHPRIDASGGNIVVADEMLSADILQTLSTAHEVVTTKRTVFPYAFACPAGVMRVDGKNMGCTEIMSPWGDAVTEENT